jgi:hypothetical protein
MKGKTAREVADIAEQFRGLAVNSQLGQQTPLQPAQQPAFSYQQAAPPDPSIAYSQPELYQQQLLAYQNNMLNERLQQAAQPLLRQTAQLARSSSMQDPKFSEVWRRWGHEIDAQMANTPADMRTVENYNLVAQFVKSNHIDELAEERAQKMLNSGGLGLERGANAGGAPVAPSVSPLDELFGKADHPWVQKAKDSGMGIRDIREQLPKMGYTEQQFVESILKDQSFGGSR